MLYHDCHIKPDLVLIDATPDAGSRRRDVRPLLADVFCTIAR
jgi:hypothetical protein